jgi:hypothetical protein
VNDVELGARLHDLSARLDLPEADLVDGVLARIEAGAAAPRRSRRGARLAVAAAVAVAVLAAALAIEPSRQALADWFGIGSTIIRRVPETDLPAPRTRPDLGREEPVRPGDAPLPALGPPAAAYRRGADVRSYAWAASPDLPALAGSDLGAVLGVRPAEGVPVTKLVPTGDPVEGVSVGGVLGLWIPGDHVLLGPDGTPTKAERVLLWVKDGREYRLEANIDRDRAVALAEKVAGTAGG